MRRILIAFLLMVLAFPAFAAEKESAYDRVMRTGVIRVGYSVWPPYQIRNPNTGELSGNSADIMKIFSGLLGLKTEWVQQSGLGTQVEELKQGKYDVVINDGPYVFSMIKFIDFSNPYLYAPVHAYVRSDEHRFKNLQDLNSADVTFVGLDGDLSADLVGRLYPMAKLTTLPASTDPGMLMLNVLTKKADVAIVDPGSVHTFNKTHNPGLKAFAESTPVAVYAVGFSMMKGDEKLLTLVNGTVAAMNNTNLVDPVLKKWLPEKGDYYPVAKPYQSGASK